MADHEPIEMVDGEKIFLFTKQGVKEELGKGNEDCFVWSHSNDKATPNKFPVSRPPPLITQVPDVSSPMN